MRPIIFGEVLFDILPDGQEVLGGAPFNVAWHLKGFGHDPLMITRVGSDHRGDLVKDKMARWEMDPSGVQTDEQYPTGNVIIDFQNGEPRFDIKYGQAFDFIDPEFVSRLPIFSKSSILYHGSLAARSLISATALRRILSQIEYKSFIDINLRNPWWSEATANELITGSNWLKLNEEELQVLAVQKDNSIPEIINAAHQLNVRFSLMTCLVTMGKQGALVVDRNGNYMIAKPPGLSSIVDTVGAGDAFSAVYIHGIISGWSASSSLNRAVDFAADICLVQGATTPDTVLYLQHQEKWEGEKTNGD